MHPTKIVMTKEQRLRYRLAEREALCDNLVIENRCLKNKIETLGEALIILMDFKEHFREMT